MCGSHGTHKGHDLQLVEDSAKVTVPSMNQVMLQLRRMDEQLNVQAAALLEIGENLQAQHRSTVAIVDQVCDAAISRITGLRSSLTTTLEQNLKVNNPRSAVLRFLVAMLLLITGFA